MERAKVKPGKPQKFGEASAIITIRVPASKKKEIQIKIANILKSYHVTV